MGLGVLCVYFLQEADNVGVECGKPHRISPLGPLKRFMA